jgi:hypothetical protein
LYPRVFVGRVHVGEQTFRRAELGHRFDRQLGHGEDLAKTAALKRPASMAWRIAGAAAR